MKYSHRTIATVCGVAALFVLATLGRADGPVEPGDAQTLLAALRQLRQATYDACTSGTGTAEIRYVQLDKPTDKADLDAAKSRIMKFKYTGDRVSLLELDATRHILSRQLVVGEEYIQYVHDIPHRQRAGVLIKHSRASDPTGGPVDLAPSQYNYAAICRLPYRYGEARLFERDIPAGRCTVTRHGTILSVDLDRREGNERTRLDFDLALGGMVVKVDFAQNLDGVETAHGTYQWANRDGKIVPVQFDTELESTNALQGSYMRWKSRITFQEFAIGPVPAQMLSVASLGIPFGTPVFDGVRKQEFTYSPQNWQEKTGWPIEDPGTTRPAGSIKMEMGHDPAN